MTRRERLEAKIARRQEWAQSRRATAATLEHQNERYHGDTAFNTQPGHIPERARVIRRSEQAAAHLDMAAHHLGKADGLAIQLDRSVFSDDADAVAHLEARIAVHEAQRDRMKAINAAIRKGPGWEARIQPPLSESENTELISLAHAWAGVYKPGFPSYALTNLGARIRADKVRLAELETRAIRTEQAEAAGVLIEGDDFLRVTFPEKPERSILDALRAAGFRWSQGSWYGSRTALPEAVAALVN